jgi:hypothetical protein
MCRERVKRKKKKEQKEKVFFHYRIRVIIPAADFSSFPKEPFPK